MASNTGKFLNQENISKKTFDNVNDAVRVNIVAGSGGSGSTGLTNAELRATPVPVVNTGSTSVVISATDDSIAIGNPNSNYLLEINADGSINAKIPSVTRVANITTSSTTGTTLAAQKITFSNIGAATATVAGGSLPAGLSVTFVGNNSDVVAPIAFNATGTTLMISKLT